MNIQEYPGIFGDTEDLFTSFRKRLIVSSFTFKFNKYNCGYKNLFSSF